MQGLRIGNIEQNILTLDFETIVSTSVHEEDDKQAGGGKKSCQQTQQ